MVKYFFVICLLIGCILAVYFLLQIFFSIEKKHFENRMVAVCCASSAIWSLGFGVLILQKNTEWAYYCRSFGMIGVFLFLISVQVLVCHISGIGKKWRYLLNGFSFTGIFIYFLTIQKSEVVYHPSEMGMTYFFKKGLCNNLYTAYSVIVAIDILSVTIYMIRFSKVKRIRAFGKQFILVEFLVVLGMMLDTIFPLIGKAAIPGSSLTQFWGLAVLYHAVYVINRSRINIKNMSEFIYYSLAMPVLVFDVDRKLQIINDAAASFLGISREAAGTEQASLGSLFEIGEEEIFSFAQKRKDVDAVCHKNDVYCSLAINKIADNYGDVIGYIVIVTDLSERMKTIQELEKAFEEAESANRAKSTFLANMSHEIRTPMNAIIGFSELVLKRELDKQTREYVEDIKASAGNLLAIINDILDFSKIESGKMELVCKDYYTAGLFNDIYLIINTQAKKKGLDFHMTIDPDMPNKLFGDSIRIRGVMINLLNNALKYTEQGSVSFQVTVSDKKEDIATLKFRVADTGIGIRQEDQDKLFESFSRADMKLNYGVEGTGLGLAIAKGYITLMDGEVTVESTYGEGSVFTVVVQQKIIDASPLDKSYAEENEAVEEFSIGNMKISGVKVLVVDDNLVNLKVADNSLKYYGLTVDTAASGQEAIELCKNNHYQMIFMDQMMPQMDGTEAMRQIRMLDSYYAYGGACKIIVLTANAIIGVREDLLGKGFDEYLGKPMNYKQLEKIFLRFIPKEKIQTVTEKEQGQVQQNTKVDNTAEIQTMLPEVELSTGIQNCGGQLYDYLSVLQMIYRDGEDQLEELGTLIQQQAYKDYTIKIHALKGTALNIGAKQASEMARLLEQAGRKEDQVYIDSHMEEFQQAFGVLLSHIRTVLNHCHMLEDVQKQKEKKVLEDGDILQILKDVRERIEEYDFAKAVSSIREARQNQMSGQYQEVFAQMEQWLDEMEIEKVQEALDRLVD